VCDELGVGVARDLGAALLEAGAQREVVLDDAVVDDDDRSRDVRMRVHLGWPPVGRPARVTDADAAGQRSGRELRLEVPQLADRTDDLDVTALDVHRHARGVVAAVLEPLEPVDEDGRSLLRPDVPDDSTHTMPPALRASRRSGAVYHADGTSARRRGSRPGAFLRRTQRARAA
jgi:hypothetical protein